MEYNALKSVYDDARKPWIQMYGELRAEIRNQYSRRNGKPWTGADFTGIANESKASGVTPIRTQSVEAQKANLAMMFSANRKHGEVFSDKDDPVTRAGNG